MLLDPNNLTPRDIYQLMIRIITPRPIAWVSSISADGIPNLAPFSFFTGVTANPPSLVFSPVNRRDGSKKDTVVNIEANGEFVVNVVPHRLAEAMNQTSAEYPPDVNECDAANVDMVASTRVKPMRVKSSPIQLECERIQIVEVGEGPLAANLIIGKILLMHVDDAVLNQDGKIDPELVDAVGRMGGAGYATTRSRFELARPEIT